MMKPLRPLRATRTPVARAKAAGGTMWLAVALIAMLTMVAQWPAHWASMALNHFSQGRVLLLEARGTIWHGSAFLALGAGPGGGPATAWQQRIQWDLTPSALNEVTLNVAATEGTTLNPWTWQMRWLPSGWQVQAGRVDWGFSSQWLTGLGAPWNTIEPKGQVRISSPGWQWRQTDRSWHSQGQFTLKLLDFSTQLSSLKPLGDYQLLIDSTPNPHVDLKTLQGPLQLVGHGIWHDGKLQFEGEAWALQAQDELVLSNLLGVLGTRNGARAILKVG